MSNSSVPESPFEGVSWPHVLSLLTCLTDATVRNEAFVERRYREQARNYAATAGFLVGIGVLAREGGQLLPRESLPLDASGRRDAILRRIARSSTHYGSELRIYVAGYELIAGQIKRPAELVNVSRHSAVRNLLMEMGIVRYEEATRGYLLDPAHAWLFALAHAKSRPMSPARLASRLDRQDDLGWRAEAAIVEYERVRIGPQFAHLVEHTSEKDVAAGYDVLSVTLQGDKTLSRFIEVKAVSRHSMRFYWTQNEVEVARAVGPFYYLYLVPVRAGVPDVEHATIVQDPCSAVLHGDNWEVDTNVYECQVRRTDSTEGAKER